VSGLGDSCDHPQRGAFTTAVVTEDSVDLSWFYLHEKVEQNSLCHIGVNEVIANHSSLLPVFDILNLYTRVIRCCISVVCIFFCLTTLSVELLGNLVN
jgi:hypothetical protein